MDNVTVFILTCNRPEDLRRCLQSVQQQTRKADEILVVNNGDDTATEAVLKEFPVTVIQDKTKKLSYLFNLGWRHAANDYVAFLADDAVMDHLWLETGMAALIRYPRAAVVTGPFLSTQPLTGQMHLLHTRAQNSFFLKIAADWYERFIQEGRTFDPCHLCASGSYTLGQGLEPKSLDDQSVDLATSSCMLGRRQALLAVNGFDEHFLFNHADGDLFVRLKKRGFAIMFIPLMRALHYTRMGPSRNPFYIGRDTAYFYLKDVRPQSFLGCITASCNVLVLNLFWVYSAVANKSVLQLSGILGFLRGTGDFICDGIVRLLSRT